MNTNTKTKTKSVAATRRWRVVTLAIETSCDDTAVAILADDLVLANIVASQTEVHAEHGGVVPWLAKGEHEKMLEPSINTALQRSGLKSWDAIDVIAVTHGPGLAPALEVGVRTAKQLAKKYNKPLVAVNHLEGHVLSPFLKNSKGNYYANITDIVYPALILTVSGGHTEIVRMEGIGHYEIIGRTLDDAAGEAFDKIARMLDLGYPGGPVLAYIGQEGNATAYDLPRPMAQSDNLNFSFSGLKTACLYNTNDLKTQLGEKFATIIPDYAASVQEAIVDSLVGKFKKAITQEEPKMVLVTGGVSANKRLRQKMRAMVKQFGLPLYFPDRKFCMDNAAMIGLAAWHQFQRHEVVADIDALDRRPSLNFSTRT